MNAASVPSQRHRPSSTDETPSWSSLEASRPLRAHFVLLPSDPRQRSLTAAWALHRESSGHLSPPLYRILDPTFSPLVFPESPLPQPLVNLDVLFLQLGFSPLQGILKWQLSRWKGDYTLPGPFPSAKDDQRNPLAWRGHLWGSLLVARKIVADVGGEEALQHFGTILGWKNREAWTLDEPDEGRLTHNWLPVMGPVASTASSSSGISTDKLLGSPIASVSLLSKSASPTFATLLHKKNRQALIESYIQLKDVSTETRDRQLQSEVLRSRLLRWTVRLADEIEEWAEDYGQNAVKVEYSETEATLDQEASIDGHSPGVAEINDMLTSLVALLPASASGGSSSSQTIGAVLLDGLPLRFVEQAHTLHTLWTLVQRTSSLGVSTDSAVDSTDATERSAAPPFPDFTQLLDLATVDQVGDLKVLLDSISRSQRQLESRLDPRRYESRRLEASLQVCGRKISLHIEQLPQGGAQAWSSRGLAMLAVVVAFVLGTLVHT